MYVIRLFSFHRVRGTLVCIDEQSFTDMCALLFRTLHVSWSVYILQLSAIAHSKYEICRFYDLECVNTSQIMQHMAKDSFWDAEGAPILFSDLGFCMASCSSQNGVARVTLTLPSFYSL